LPSFSDLLAKEVEAKKSLLEKCFTHQESSIKSLLDEKLRYYWVDFAAQPSHDLSVVAVDAGVYSRVYANGVAISIARGIAITSSGREYKVLNLDVSSTVKKRHFPSYLEFLSELTEYSAASLALQSEKDVDIVLIDGSLHGRLLHTPVSLNVGSNPALYIDLMSNFMEFYEKARKQNALVVGVSKDSTASIFKKYLLEEILASLLKDQGEDIIVSALNVLKVLKERRSLSIIKAQELASKLPSHIASLFRELYEEYVYGETDFAFIHRNVSQGNINVGFSMPMLLGCTSIRIKRFVDEAERVGYEKVIEQTWKDYVVGLDQDEISFVKSAAQKLRKVFEVFPTVASFYIVLNKLDLPLRVEFFMPHGQSFFKSDNLSFLSLETPFMDEVLSLISAGYGGPNLYNVWLTAAHKLAKMSRKAFDVYEKQIFEQCGIEVSKLRRSWLV